MSENYGVFGEFWNGFPNHLPFLNLSEIPAPPKEWNLAKSIDRLEFIISTNTEKSVIEGIKLLFESDNWRPHLVASLATLKISQIEQLKLKTDLRNRLKLRSWVSPQILAILSMIDPDFQKFAAAFRVKAYKTNYTDIRSLQDNMVRGPVELTIDDSKTMAAAQYLLNGEVVNTDENEHGGSIAKNWKASLLKLIETGKFKVARNDSFR